jgi:hypothetical protein
LTCGFSADGEDGVGRDGGADCVLLARDIAHIGSAHDEVELELLKAVARQRLAAGQGEFDLGLDTGAAGGPLPITSSRMGCLLGKVQPRKAFRASMTAWGCSSGT